MNIANGGNITEGDVLKTKSMSAKMNESINFIVSQISMLDALIVDISWLVNIYYSVLLLLCKE